MSRVIRRAFNRKTNQRSIRLRAMTREQARRVLERNPAPNDDWAPGYPTEGDLEAASSLLRQIALGNDPEAYGPYEIVAGENLIVGGVGFHAPPDASGVVEVGYGIVEDERNKGYATAALKALLETARQLGTIEVEARAEPTNLASRRVMEKAGMTLDGLLRGLVVYRLRFPAKVQAKENHGRAT